jgi:MFS family permease
MCKPGFIIIWSKLSDIIGRKAAINATMVIFVAFSAGCGASQTLSQLSVTLFRKCSYYLNSTNKRPGLHSVLSKALVLLAHTQCPF